MKYVGRMAWPTIHPKGMNNSYVLLVAYLFSMELEAYQILTEVDATAIRDAIAAEAKSALPGQLFKSPLSGWEQRRYGVTPRMACGVRVIL